MSDLARWTAHLAELAPSSTVGQPYDVAAAIYRAYDEERIGTIPIRTRGTAHRAVRKLAP